MIGHISEDQTIWKKRYFDLTVDHVCKTCNGGWMSDIETKARDSGDVLRMILGVPAPPLTPKGQLDFVNWCFLKALTVELSRPPDQRPTYPQAMYAAFRRDKKPPTPNCSIALGFRNISEPDPLFVWSRSQGRNFPVGPSEVPSETGYNTTVLIGHLVIDVAGLLRPLNAKVDHGEGFVPIWPVLPGKAFPWPPSKRFSGVANNDLT
jgi:hypothetical protein